MSDEVMADIQRTLGRIEGTLNGHVKAFDDHIKMDMEAYKAIGALKEKAAGQKGFVTALGFIAGGLSYVVGWIAEKLFFPHH